MEPKRHTRSSPYRFRPWLVLVALSLLVTCTYINSVRNDFVFDDLERIKYEPSIRKLENIPGMLNIFERSYRYRPLRTISYAIDYSLSGLNPLVYHISNLIFHTLCSFLVFLLVRSVTGKGRAGLFASLLFAVHPVQTEAVAYISGRRDLLATLFYLASAWLFVEYRRTARPWRIPLIVISIVLGILSKETVLAVPGFFLLYDFMRQLHDEKRVGESRISLPYTLFCTLKKHAFLYLPLIAAAFGVLLFLTLYSPVSQGVGLYGGSIASHLMMISRILAQYFRLILLPYPLRADYSYNVLTIPDSFLDGPFIISFLSLCVVIWLVVYMIKKDFSTGLFMGWFLLNLIPVSQFIPHHELMAEHHLYLPSVGISALTAILLERLLIGSSGARSLVSVVFGLIIIVSSMVSIDRNRDWKDSMTLWTETIRTSPNCARAHYNLGTVCLERGDLDCAVVEFEEAIRIKPGYEKYNNKIWLLFAKTHDNLGLVYNARGKDDLAIEQFKEGLKINFGTNTSNDPGRQVFANLHNNLGKVYLERMLFDQAELEFRKALRVNPGFRPAHNNLGVLYVSIGRDDLAEKCFISVLQIEPMDEEAFRNLAALYGARSPGAEAPPHCALGHRLLDAGLKDLATRELEVCLTLDPDHPEASRLLESLTN